MKNNRHEQHGDTSRNSRTYRIWLDMKHRCNYLKHNSYKDYGGRGIKVCDEWEFYYSKFKSWALANGYNEKLSLDRIDVNVNYEPNNCRWATQIEQANNTRKNIYISYNDETHTLAEWGRILNIPYSTIITRHKRKWSIERMLNTPVKIKNYINPLNPNEYYHKYKEKINARRKELRDLNKAKYNKKQREYKASKRVIK